MIHSLNLDNFYLTEEQLDNSPSRQDGIDKDTEANLRMYGCELIQEAGIMLGFHQVVMATGQVLLHRFYCKRSMKNFNVKKVAATALWVGAKLEEVKVVRDHPKKLLEMVMASVDRCITRREPGHELGVLDIHSKAGDDFRRSLIRYESEMLKAFGFIMNVEHPHRLLCNYAQIMFLPYITNPDADADKRDFVTNFIQVAWNVANDSLRTTLCVRFKGSVTACGIIFYTARKLQVPMPDNWWELFTVKLEDMCEVCRVLHELYLTKRSTFVPVCHQLLPSKPPTLAIAAGGAAANGGVTATATPMLGSTPELNTRPGDKPLDPSVRRVVPASASTPSLVQVAAAAGAGAADVGGSVLASPEGRPAPGSARKRSRSPKSPAEDGDLRKRQQLDSKQQDPSDARKEQQLQQQAQQALAAAGTTLQRPRSASGHRDGGDGGLRRPGSAGGDRDRDRDHSRRGDRDRDRDKPVDRLRRDRPRSRSRDRSSRRSRSRDRKGRRSRSRDRPRRSRSRDRSRRSRSRSRDRRREREQRDSKDRSGRDRADRDRGGEIKSPLKPDRQPKQQQQQQQREPSSPSQRRQLEAGSSSLKADKPSAAGAVKQGPAVGDGADDSSRGRQQQQQHGSSANGSHKASTPEWSPSQPQPSKPAEDVSAAKSEAAAAAGGSSKASLPPVQPKPKPKAVRKHPPSTAGVTSPISSPSADVGNAPGGSAPGGSAPATD